TANLPGPGNTRQFDYVFPFTTPFLYDPAAGNLVLSFQFEGSGSAVTFDTVSGDSTIGEVFNGSSSTATTGSPITPKVTQFTFQPPPLVTIRASQVEVCWNSQSNLTYQVQYRSDLTTNLWTSLVGCIRSTGSVTCINDPIVVGQPQRFYRVVLTNCIP
ncbi:MAG: putative rane protein, partial [Acidobacteria bacterium]|nr:putative rane protein [Acidobacteriota bacterium]